LDRVSVTFQTEDGGTEITDWESIEMRVGGFDNLREALTILPRSLSASCIGRALTAGT
jgi:hypothetical protein